MNHNLDQIKSQLRSLFFFGFLISILFAVSCSGPGARTEHPDLDWLEGRWFAREAGFHENWERSGNNELRGAGFTLENGDTLFSETLRIFHSDTGTFYQALMQEQNEGKPVYFKLVHHEPDSLVFSNPNHDFPNYIIYKKLAEDSLRVHVRDGLGEDSRGFSMEMHKKLH